MPDSRKKQGGRGTGQAGVNAAAAISIAARDAADQAAGYEAGKESHGTNLGIPEEVYTQCEREFWFNLPDGLPVSNRYFLLTNPCLWGQVQHGSMI